MYLNPVGSITNKVFNKKYNILCAPTHERWESALAQTGHNFYAWRKHGVFKPGWNEQFAPIPPNYYLLDERDGDNQLWPWLNLDVALSQNKFGQYQIISQLARLHQIPLISVEHTASMEWWTKEQKKQLKEMRGIVNVFITEWSLESWGWDNRNDTKVIRHCVDSELFKPDKNQARNNYILTVGNDYIGRDSVLNFSQYKRVCLDNGLPVKPVGDTKGLSVAPKSVTELINEYQTSNVFLNTHHVSPVPTSLLEAAACGCGIVSCNTCGIPEFFTHGENAMLYNNDKECLEYLLLLLNDTAFATKLGINARNMIKEKCSLDRFIKEWTEVFNLACNMKG